LGRKNLFWKKLAGTKKSITFALPNEGNEIEEKERLPEGAVSS
jgi:hypothetical protein